jgi:hypothetical protein
MTKLSDLADRLEEHNCPRPIDENITVGACLRAGTCGCEERETYQAAAALREAEMVLREVLEHPSGMQLHMALKRGDQLIALDSVLRKLLG